MMTTKHKMIDIHMHLIPGVDDGAEDMMMAQMMLLRAGDQGIRKIFATPHSEDLRCSQKRVRGVFYELSETVETVFPDMEVYLGCEVYCEERKMGDVLDALESGLFPTMNGTRYVLTEFSQWVSPEETIPCMKALVNAGYVPIIAHMERYEYLRENMSLVNRFRKLGALIQLNVYSLSDELDDSIRNWARRLILERKVDFLGTDAHRTYHRPPSAELGLSWLYQAVDAGYADAVAWENARELLLKR